MPTARQYQNLVIASLSAADPPAQTDLQSKVPLYWSLYALKARWPDIRFWYTYREGVMFLMGRMSQTATDQVRRNSRSTGDTQADVVSTGNSLSNASTDQSETGRSTSSHKSIRKLDGGSSTNGGSNFTSRRLIGTTQHHDDSGSGSGTESSFIYKSSDQLRHHYSIDADRVQGIAHKEIEHGDNTIVDPATNTQTHFAQDTFKSRTRLVEADTMHEHYENFNNNVDKIVTGFVQGSGAGGTQLNANGTTDISGNTQSAHHFDARVEEGSTITADPNINQSNGSSSLVQSSNDIGSTHGSSQLTSRTDTAHHGAGSTVAVDSTVGITRSLNMGASHFQMQKLQQKFLHLNELWQEATKRIKTLEQQAVIAERYQVLAMKSMYIDDFPDSQSAILANTPALRNLDPNGVLLRFPLL